MTAADKALEYRELAALLDGEARVELPAPPACPKWCTEMHESDWDVISSVGEMDRRCCHELPAGEDVDGNPVRVVLTRFAFPDSESGAPVMEVCAPRIEVACVEHHLDASNALTLCLALAHAAVMIEQG